jgi:predicted site-specific integrase-resolvase
MTDTLMTEAAAAEYLGLSPRTLQRWRVTGQGPTYRKLGKRVAYSTEDLREYLGRVRRSSTSTPSPEAA